jgi:hypothetical protein
MFPFGILYFICRGEWLFALVSEVKMNNQLPHKRGAPYRNQNARKHGYYSRILSTKDKHDLQRASSVEGVDEEIALLRFKLKSVLQKDPDNFRLITEALLSLNRLMRTRGKVQPDFQDSLTRAYENVMRDYVIPLGMDPAVFLTPPGNEPPKIMSPKQDL